MGFLKRLLTWWNGQTINTQFYTWLKGEFVGDDEQGNRYFRSRKGDRRWVIFNGESEASRVSADWHGWLHKTYDELPSERPLKKQKWVKEHKANQTGTATAYAPTGSLRGDAAIASDYEAWQPE